jgi:uncharacterized repeat protein (TIGR03803 family)
MPRIGPIVREFLPPLVASLALVGCGGSGGGDNSNPPPPAQKYTVGGSVSGLLSGTSVVLFNNGGDALTVSSNGSFTFATSVTSGSPYAITVSTEPSGQVCQISGGSGSVGATNVTSASVNCATAYAIGGSIAGLGVTGLILANGTDTFAVPADATSFAMPQGMSAGSAYDVVVQTNPAFVNCTVTGGAGTVNGGDVTSIVVTCAPGMASVFYSFGPPAQEGTWPVGGLMQASDGNFYGLAFEGGASDHGAVYKITPEGVESILYSFKAESTDGWYPIGRLIEASDGNFYGVTSQGGIGGGVAFKVTPTGIETVLYAFGKTSTDGIAPAGALIQASDGNFYGTTQNGGAYGSQGGGTVFRITPGGTESVLYSFSPGGPDGTYPTGSLIQASDGNFYGMTAEGGANGCGDVFKITLGGTQSVVYSFQAAGVDGSNPVGNLVQGSDGNFYGMTAWGGLSGSNDWGTIFKLTPGGTETVLHSFMGGTSDGRIQSSSVSGDVLLGNNPSLIQGNDGNFYGITNRGGQSDVGVFVRFTPDGEESVLYSFTGAADGGFPVGALMQAKDGTLYGVGGATTVSNGVVSGGVVLKVN